MLEQLEGALRGPLFLLESIIRRFCFHHRFHRGDRRNGQDGLADRYMAGFECGSGGVGVFGLVEEVGVDGEGRRRFGVAELAGHEHDVESAGDEQRREAVTQGVQRQPTAPGDPGVFDTPDQPRFDDMKMSDNTDMRMSGKEMVARLLHDSSNGVEYREVREYLEDSVNEALSAGRSPDEVWDILSDPSHLSPGDPMATWETIAVALDPAPFAFGQQNA
jgi:hypothetical protein